MGGLEELKVQNLNWDKGTATAPRGEVGCWKDAGR